MQKQVKRFVVFLFALALTFSVCPQIAQASENSQTKVIVSTKEELAKALSNPKVNTMIVVSEDLKVLTIDSSCPMQTGVSLTIDASNAKIAVDASFSSIKINDAKKLTVNSNVAKVVINDDILTFKIGDDGQINKVVLKASDDLSKIKLVNNGSINRVETKGGVNVNATNNKEIGTFVCGNGGTVSIKNSGNIGTLATTPGSSADDSSVSLNCNNNGNITNVKIKSDNDVVNFTQGEDAGKTVIKLIADNAVVNIDNQGTSNVCIDASGCERQVVRPGKSASVNDSNESAIADNSDKSQGDTAGNITGKTGDDTAGNNGGKAGADITGNNVATVSGGTTDSGIDAVPGGTIDDDSIYDSAPIPFVPAPKYRTESTIVTKGDSEYKQVLTYDNDDRIVKQEMFLVADNALVAEVKFTYLKDKIRTVSTYYNPLTKAVIQTMTDEADSLSRLIFHETRDANGKLTESQTKVFNSDDGTCLRTEIEYDNGDRVERELYYYYDDEYNVDEIISEEIVTYYGDSDNVATRFIMYLDDAGNEIITNEKIEDNIKTVIVKEYNGKTTSAEKLLVETTTTYALINDGSERVLSMNEIEYNPDNHSNSTITSITYDETGMYVTKDSESIVQNSVTVSQTINEYTYNSGAASSAPATKKITIKNYSLLSSEELIAYTYVGTSATVLNTESVKTTYTPNLDSGISTKNTKVVTVSEFVNVASQDVVPVIGSVSPQARITNKKTYTYLQDSIDPTYRLTEEVVNEYNFESAPLTASKRTTTTYDYSQNKATVEEVLFNNDGTSADTTSDTIDFDPVNYTFTDN